MVGAGGVAGAGAVALVAALGPCRPTLTSRARIELNSERCSAWVDSASWASSLELTGRVSRGTSSVTRSASQFASWNRLSRPKVR